MSEMPSEAPSEVPRLGTVIDGRPPGLLLVVALTLALPLACGIFSGDYFDCPLRSPLPFNALGTLRSWPASPFATTTLSVSVADPLLH